MKNPGEVSQEVNQLIDEVELMMLNAGTPFEPEIRHHFTPGLYCREMIIPDDVPGGYALISSKIHRLCHPFVVSAGKLLVRHNGEVEVIAAPYYGETQPGTRRVAFAEAGTHWLTFHTITDGETLEQIEARIIEPHENPLIGNKYQELLKEKEGSL